MAENFKRSLEWFLARRGDREDQFKIAEKKVMAKTKFPPEFEQPVNMATVHLDIIRPWVSKKVWAIISSIAPSSFFLT